MAIPTLTWDGEYVTTKRALPGNKELTIQATELRQERTGIHGRLRVICDTTILAWSVFNLERDEDRTRIANTSYKNLPHAVRTAKGENNQQYLASDLKHELDLFAAHVWDAYRDHVGAVEVEGNAMLPIEYLAKPHIVEGAGTILFGPPGMGKSYTALLIAMCIEAQLNHYWHVEKPAKTLFVNLERDSRSITRRLGAVATALGLEPDRRMLVLNARGKSLRDVADVVRRDVEKHRVDVLVLDSISRAGMGKLTEDQAPNSICDTLNGLCPTWLALAHSPRADATHVYGSMFFDAAADIVVRLMSQRVGTSLGIGLEVVKTNDTATPPVMYLKYDFDEYGITTVSPAHGDSFAEILAQLKQSVPDAIYDYLINEVGEATASQIATALGKDRSNVSRILAADSRFIRTRRQGNERYYGVGLPLEGSV